MTTLTDPALSAVHRAYLNEHAITDRVIEDTGIFSLYDDIVFPWADDGQLTAQRRRWPEDEVTASAGKKSPAKYRWEPGRPSHLWGIRPLGDLPADAKLIADDPSLAYLTAGAPVLLCEGTKQSLAVASWAPPEYVIFGMSGCWGWSHDQGKPVTDLARFAGRQVFILLDADAGANLDVYEAGEKLAVQLELEDAIPGFVPSPAWGKGGIDDYLAGIQPGRRAERMTKLLARGQSKPADRRPTHRKLPEQMPENAGGLPMVTINKDRREVIHEILGHMMARWNGHSLFSYGGALTTLREAATEPLDEGAFLRWLIEGILPVKYTPPGLTAPAKYEATWPDQQTIKALLASGSEFAPLRRVSRTPFARPDGTICAKDGYDPATATVLVAGNSGMDRLQVPDAPTQADAAMAASYLLDTWLGDRPELDRRGIAWRDTASRANALALILTPFIRGIVPLAPLAVVSGVQHGVGKNLLADCISLMTSGENLQPLQWIPDDDEEVRKQLTSAFRAGSSLICLDEAHVISGAALSRAVTATTYADRILGVSKMVSYPNLVTWLALGNQVQVLADMGRRVYFIELYPDEADPQDLDETRFTHPDIRGWTRENRPELVTRALTLIRAWFAAGCPAFSRGHLMGSFENWDKIMSGILGYAGVEGFLGNLTERRAERDATGGFWAEHIVWLREQFGAKPFTCLDVKVRAMASGGAWDAPPRLDDPNKDGFPRLLGQAYARVIDRRFGDLQLYRSGMGHGTKVKWVVRLRGEDVPGSDRSENQPPPPVTYPPVGQTLPEQGGMERMGQTQNPAQPEGPVPGIGGLQTGTLPEQGVSSTGQFGNTLPEQAFPETANRRDGTTSCSIPTQTPPDLGCGPENPLRDGTDGTSTPGVMRVRWRAGAHAHIREGAGDPSITSVPSIPGLALGIDLETGDAGELFTHPRGLMPEDGGYVRLCGLIGPSGEPEIVSLDDALAMCAAAERLYGHNVLGFDGLTLAWHHGFSWDEFCRRALDTELIMRQAYPPRSRESGGSQDKRGLDASAELLGLPGKTDNLPRLKRKHGGYMNIPLDDEEFRDYLRGDMYATKGVTSHLVRHYDGDPYLPREHRLAQIAGHMSLSGFAVDIPLLEQRIGQGEDKREQALDFLHAEWGLPLTKTVTRGRGDNKTSSQVRVDAPLATDAGREWLAGQWERYQVAAPPLTDTGRLAIGSDDLAAVAADPDCPGDLRTMIALMSIVTGTRTVYQTIKDNLAPDGRVHPRSSFRQASGRWSVTDPGLTVLGKHDGRHIERDVLIPDHDKGEPWVLLTCDLRQVDMRAMAALSQDPAYMALFGFDEKGDPLDPHLINAIKVFGSGDHRQHAKAIGHGWNYGLGANRMIREGRDPERVWAFVHGMEASYPRLIAWREEIRAIGKAGLILDNGWGRRMMAEPARAYTVAPALMGQGGARDIMCECLLRLPPELWQFLRVMVHDEIVLAVPAWAAEEIGHILMEAMTWVWRDVPILCDLSKPGASWGAISDK